MIVHILTGCKGGVGKTLCALSAINHYQQVLAVDLNTSNADLSRILWMQRQPEAMDVQANTGRDGPSTSRFAVLPFRANWGYVMRPIDPFVIPFGALGFWLQVIHGLAFSRTTPVAIIDTHLHPANLIPGSGEQRSEVVACIQALLEGGVDRCFVWIIWTLAAMSRTPGTPHDLVAIGDMIKQLPEKLAKCFTLIHVLNPYAVVPEVTRAQAWNALLPGGQQPRQKIIKGLDRLADPSCPTGSSIPYDEFCTTVDRALQNTPLVQTATNNVFVPLAEGLLSHGKLRRPSNVFAVSIFGRDVVNFTDTLATSAPQTFPDVMKPLAGPSSQIARYLGLI